MDSAVLKTPSVGHKKCHRGWPILIQHVKKNDYDSRQWSWFHANLSFNWFSFIPPRMPDIISRVRLLPAFSDSRRACNRRKKEPCCCCDCCCCCRLVLGGGHEVLKDQRSGCSLSFLDCSSEIWMVGILALWSVTICVLFEHTDLKISFFPPVRHCRYDHRNLIHPYLSVQPVFSLRLSATIISVPPVENGFDFFFSDDEEHLWPCLVLAVRSTCPTFFLRSVGASAEKHVSLASRTFASRCASVAFQQRDTVGISKQVYVRHSNRRDHTLFVSSRSWKPQRCRGP